jgi:hypothetical protein
VAPTEAFAPVRVVAFYEAREARAPQMFASAVVNCKIELLLPAAAAVAADPVSIIAVAAAKVAAL